MSELRVDNIVDMGGSGAPQLRKGASVTGISTITQAVIGNTTINDSCKWSCDSLVTGLCFSNCCY